MALRKGRRAMRAAAALALATLILPAVLLRKSVVEEWQILNLRYGGELKKWRAARKLGEARYRRAVPALITALKDRHESVREAAVEALVMMGPDAKLAMSGLVEAARSADEKSVAAINASRALLKLDRETAAVPAPDRRAGESDQESQASPLKPSDPGPEG